MGATSSKSPHSKTLPPASITDGAKLTMAGSPALVDRVRGALWGLFIADALSMPVHWYYDVGALRRDFGRITDYQAPKARHPSAYARASTHPHQNIMG